MPAESGSSPAGKAMTEDGSSKNLSTLTILALRIRMELPAPRRRSLSSSLSEAMTTQLPRERKSLMPSCTLGGRPGSGATKRSRASPCPGRRERSVTIVPPASSIMSKRTEVPFHSILYLL